MFQLLDHPDVVEVTDTDVGRTAIILGSNDIPVIIIIVFVVVVILCRVLVSEILQT